MIKTIYICDECKKEFIPKVSAANTLYVKVGMDDLGDPDWEAMQFCNNCFDSAHNEIDELGQGTFEDSIRYVKEKREGK